MYFLCQCRPGFLQDGLSLSGSLSLDSVTQCSLLDATYGLSFSKGLSALGLEPHLLLLLLHKHRGSRHVQRVSALPLTLPLCYILARVKQELLWKHLSGCKLQVLDWFAYLALGSHLKSNGKHICLQQSKAYKVQISV